MSSLFISPPLSESSPSEYDLAVIVTRRNFGYGAKRNWQSVPLGQVEAGGSG